MAEHELRYDRMVEDALRSVVSKALTHVAERGLPGNHHFYITFRTDHPGVVMPESLRARYPGEMTIVLQYQFWGLEVGDDAFGVTLSFSNVPERLIVPFDSVSAFADPSVRFGLQFDVGADEETRPEEEPVVFGDKARPGAEAANVKTPDEIEHAAAGERPSADEQDKVVTLDAFRKVDGLRKK